MRIPFEPNSRFVGFLYNGVSHVPRQTPPPADNSSTRAPRSIEEVRAANMQAPRPVVDGSGDLGGTYTTAVRAPFGPEGHTDSARGQAALERMLADTAVSSQIQRDEFEVIQHDNGRYTVVLPGVIDLSSPNPGLDPQGRSVRDFDQFALPSSTNSSVESNRYAQMVREYVQQNIPHGADVMLVGHSYGADTALDLAADPTFNNAETGVNVTHVVAAAYFNQPQLDDVPQNTQVLVLQNANDSAVIGEGLGYTVTEARDAGGRFLNGLRDTAGDLLDLGSSVVHGNGDGAREQGGDLLDRGRQVLSRDSLPQPDAAVLLDTGVRRVGANTVAARFDGGTEGAGHHQSNYIDYINDGGRADNTVRGFYASVSQAGYAAPGQSIAVDVSVSDPGYQTTYPGDGAVHTARSWWDRVPGSDFVESAAGTVVDVAQTGASGFADVAQSTASGAADLAGSAWEHRGVMAGMIGDARDSVRDGAVSTWNQLPGNNMAESVVGAATDHLPFNNVAGGAWRALAGSESITLDADATRAIQADPDFVRTEAAIVDSIKSQPGYGQRALEIPLSALDVNLGLELGGERGEGSMGSQARRFYDVTDPEIRATWNVAGDELTWLLRHAQLNGTAHVSADGSIRIDYSIHDTLDLRPGEGRSGAYNAATRVMGAVWHDVLGAEEATVTGSFSREVR